MTKKLRFLMTALLLAVCGMTWAAESLTFSSLGYANSADVTTIDGSTFSMTFDQGTNTQNGPKYYTSGSSIRLYAGNTVTVTAKSGKLTNIAFTSSQGTASASTGTFSNNSWNGSAQSVTFTCTAQWRISAINVSTSTVNKKVAEVTIGKQMLEVGETTTVTTNGPEVTLTTNDEDVVTVDGTTVTAVGAGSTTVTATWSEDDIYFGGTQTFTVEVTVPEIPDPVGTKWVKTELADLTASDIFVIVGDNGSTFAMSNDKGTSSAPTAIAVNIVNNAISGKVPDNIQWNISGDADGYIFNPNGDDSKYLYCTNNNNGVRVGKNDNNVFTVSEEGYLLNSGTSRYVGVYNSEDWRCYTSINNNIKGQTFSFYKKVLPPETVPFTIKASNGYGTFCSEYPVQFTPNDNVEVYIATGINEAKTSVQTQKIEDGYVPAGVGVIVKASAAGDFTVNTAEATDVETLEGNLMVGCTVDTPAPAGCYILYAADGCFHPCSGGTIPAGKAYLNVNSESKILNIEVGEFDPTAIHEMEAVQENAAIYTLDGVRVKDAQQKGIYIINGKKVVIK